MRDDSARRSDLILALLCGLYLAASVVIIPFAYAAAHGEGTPGTFTARERDCGRYGGCSWDGTFDSDDGTIHDTQASFSSDELRKPGDQVPAVKGTAGDESIYGPDSKAWVLFAVAAVGCLAYVAWYVHSVVRRRRERAHR